MNRQRALEILESMEMVNVNYHGIPVYIQSLDANQETATVFPLDSMNHEQSVELAGLDEVRLGK
ncbi:H-type small acid-soluble spore protein [Oceanobacillus polygoni]|uniref:Small, acid-soluble spore protein H n=1 Tax=Oceanobacillus polygoni TaxID=1235259 RepID=A0A9X1CGM8_9BACI|nr:H-type small acid-soluble spore protein [Oceanobacillus polygoni]MBP2078355.1 small acid-soluble spore protein H (minor) [Oceanobacillus polygoni]